MYGQRSQLWRGQTGMGTSVFVSVFNHGLNTEQRSSHTSAGSYTDNLLKIQHLTFLLKEHTIQPQLHTPEQ